MDKICRWLACFFILIISSSCNDDLKQNPISENRGILPDSAAQGKKLFEATCVRCHGMDAAGLTGPSLIRPKLRHAPDMASFAMVVEQGIPGTGMPSNWAISDGDCHLLYVYINALKNKGRETPGGDTAAGKLVYNNAGCGNCHMMKGNGNGFGPDLSDISFSRNPSYIRQAIVDPGATLPESTDPDNGYGFSLYLPVKIVAADGKKYTGIRVNEDTYTIQIKDQGINYYSFNKQELKALEKEYGKSVMPSYLKTLSNQELNNLVAFLYKSGNQ